MLTGTERAALRLALGVLRGTDDGSYGTRTAKMLLWVGGSDLWDALDPFFDRDGHIVGVLPRILRARLALFIRALLRAERGGGPWTCPLHRGSCVVVEPREDFVGHEWWCSRCRKWSPVTSGHEPVRVASIARPLWTQARRHEGGER